MPKPDPNEPRVRYDPDYPLVGETLGLWRLLRGIGRGGMGEVYEAAYDYLHLLTLHYPPAERGVIRAELAQLPRVEQAKLASETLGTSLPPGARFAIKVCSARKGTAGHKRFLQEAELAERLGDHPYIVSVHAIHNGDGSGHIGGAPQPNLDTGRHRDVAYMVMDLAGCDYQHTELARDDAVHVIRCIATALDHAHRRGVVHRDLKPENILGSVDHPLLTDFGIAKEIDQSLGLTRTGQVIGTLDYMSPEQATDAKSVDHRSDIYSLGVVLYEMATKGQLPYLHLAQREAALAAIRSERAEPRWPRQHDAEFPRALEWIILKAMAHRRTERYQQASELLADLDRYVAGQWLWPIGRVHPRRYLRYLWNRYPKIIRGGAVAVVLLIILIVGLQLKEAFDTRRQELTRDLLAFEAVVGDVETGRAQQLDAEERERYWQRLQPRLEELQDSYPELHSRFVAAQRILERRRWLALNFSEAVGAPIDPMEGRRQLNLAFTGCEQLRPTASGSMQVQERQTWRSRHAYGTGVTYVNFLAEVAGSDFALRLLDSTTRHRTELTVRDGRLALIYQRDEEPEEINEAGRIQTPFRLDCFLEVSDDADAGVRLFIAGMPRIYTLPRPGLRPDSPVIVEIDLPAGTEIHYLEIRPQALPEE